MKKETKHEIVNDLKLDAIRSRMKPPKTGDIRDDELMELFQRIGLNYDFFTDYVKKESEYYVNKGHNFYLIKDVAKVIRHLTNIEDYKQ